MTLFRILTLVISSICIAGCAGQATRSSAPWQSANKYLFVAPVSPGLYQLDEFKTTHLGLRQILEAQMAMGIRPEVVIYAPLKKNYAQQAEIARLAEALDLTVYRYGPFGHLDIDSKELIELAGEPAAPSAD